MKDDKGNIKIEYEVEFGDKETKINGIKVKKSKVRFILGKCQQEINNTKIKLLNNLIGMKVDLLELKNIWLYRGNERIETEVKVTLDNPELFYVELLGKKSKVKWSILKDIFYDNGKSRILTSHLNISDLLKLSSCLGLNKQEVYDKLRNIVILNKLGQNNDTE